MSIITEKVRYFFHFVEKKTSFPEDLQIVLWQKKLNSKLALSLSFILFQVTCPLHVANSKWNPNLSPSFTDSHRIRHTFTFFSIRGEGYLWDDWKRYEHSLKSWHRFSWLCHTNLFIILSYFHKKWSYICNDIFIKIRQIICIKIRHTHTHIYPRISGRRKVC